MNNHFGKGLMAGLKATHADSAVNVTKFCADYKRGFVLGIGGCGRGNRSLSYPFTLK